MSDSDSGLVASVGFVASIMSILGITIFASRAIFPDQSNIDIGNSKNTTASSGAFYVKPMKPQEVTSQEKTPREDVVPAKILPEQQSFQDNSVSIFCNGRPNTDWDYYMSSTTPMVWKCSGGSYFAFQCNNDNVYLISDGYNAFTGAYVYDKHGTYRPDYNQQLAPLFNNGFNSYLLARDNNKVNQFFVFRNAQYVEMVKANGIVRLELRKVAILTKNYFPAECMNPNP